MATCNYQSAQVPVHSFPNCNFCTLMLVWYVWSWKQPPAQGLVLKYYGQGSVAFHTLTALIYLTACNYTNTPTTNQTNPSRYPAIPPCDTSLELRKLSPLLDRV